MPFISTRVRPHDFDTPKMRDMIRKGVFRSQHDAHLSMNPPMFCRQMRAGKVSEFCAVTPLAGSLEVKRSETSPLRTSGALDTGPYGLMLDPSPHLPCLTLVIMGRRC